jgi:hypothetical protein
VGRIFGLGIDINKFSECKSLLRAGVAGRRHADAAHGRTAMKEENVFSVSINLPYPIFVTFIIFVVNEVKEGI